MLRWLASIASAAEWGIIALAVLLVIAIGPAAAAEETKQCNCVAYAVEALAGIHVRLRTLPAIGVNDWFSHPGVYARGVVNLRNIEDCHTLLHELVHHAQWLKYGDARTLHENWQREMEAAMLTMHAESEMGAPRCN